MKHKTLLPLTAAVALGLVSCGKNESVTPAADDANKAAGSAAEAAARTAEAAKDAAAKVAEAAKAEASKTAEAAKAEAARVAEAARAEAEKAAQAAKTEAAKTAEAAGAKTADNAKIQGLIDRTKSLIAESKFSDASGVLQQLTGLSLSSDQQKLVDGLKEQIQKALASRAAGNAAGSVGDLLKK